MLLLIDNYDSFTYNLFQYLGELGEEVWVSRNDEVSLDEIAKKSPQHIVISPGPGTPVKLAFPTMLSANLGTSSLSWESVLGTNALDIAMELKLAALVKSSMASRRSFIMMVKGFFRDCLTPFPPFATTRWR